MRPFEAAAALATALALLAPDDAHAAVTRDAERRALVVDGRAAFAEELQHGGERFVIAGAGLLRWRWVVKVYAASYYFGEGVKADPAGDVPQRLEIEYFVGLDGPDFGKAAEKLLADAYPEEVLAPLRERLDTLARAYVDVKPGDRYALTYQPGRGTELTLNGRSLAVVPGADFARVYLSMWTGRKPIDPGLRDAILGKDRPPVVAR